MACSVAPIWTTTRGTAGGHRVRVAANAATSTELFMWRLGSTRRPGTGKELIVQQFGQDSASRFGRKVAPPAGKYRGHLPFRGGARYPQDAWLRWRGGAGGGRVRPAASRRPGPCGPPVTAAGPAAWRG